MVNLTKKRLPRGSKTDASKQNEKPTLNKSFYIATNYFKKFFVATGVLIIS